MAKPFRSLLDKSAVTPDQKKLILQMAAEMRKFEIGLLWQRSLFFWGFIGSAFIAYAAYDKSGTDDLRALIASFGIVCSVAWTLQNRGSKYWQEAWEQKVKAVETDVLGVALFSNIEPREEKGFWGARRFSVSNLLTALSDFTVLVWVALSIMTVASLVENNRLWLAAVPVAALVAAIIYSIIMGFRTRKCDKLSS